MEEMKKDLIHLTAEVRNLAAAIQYLSQRTAWSETCFKQVQDSGVMHMASMTKQIMLDHKKLQTQFSMLNMRISALITEGDSDSTGGSTPSPSGDINEKIWALAVQLNGCEVGSHEAASIIALLNELQGERERQSRSPKPKR